MSNFVSDVLYMLKILGGDESSAYVIHDRGSENTELGKVVSLYDATAVTEHRAVPQDKSYVENAIGQIRRAIIPKDVILSSISEEVLYSYIYYLNTEKKESLNGHSPV